jgi:hypothetical protein
MPHSRFDWASRIKAAEREYQAVRVAVDWLLGATPDQIHALTNERGWDDPATADIYAADRHLDATYLIRMYSVFERVVFSYWRLLPGNDVRNVEGDMRLDEVGSACVIWRMSLMKLRLQEPTETTLCTAESTSATH